MRAISFAEDAENDIDSICEYLQQHSETAAERLLEDIAERTKLLSVQPGVGRPRDDLLPGMRSSVIGKYVLFYLYDDEEVEVVRFVHGSRDIENLFGKK